MLKRLTFAFMAAFLCLIVTLGLGEFLIRLLHPQFSHLGFGYLVPDLELRHKNRADCRLKLKTKELDADFYTNSQGFRTGREIQTGSGRAQILFIGDSFTFGFGVRLDNVFSTVLQQRVDRQNLGVEVVNAGVVGYGTDQEYLLIKRLCAKGRPRLVVVNIYANDPADNVWRALFYLENGRLRENPSMPLSPTARLKWFLEAKSQLFIFLSGLLAREISKRDLWASINPHLGIMLAQFRVLVDHLHDWPFYERPGSFNWKHWYPLLDLDDFYGKGADGKMWDYAWALQRSLVREIYSLLKERDIPCLFVLVPMKSQTAGQETVFDLFQQKMINILRDLDAPFLDLREQMGNRTGLYLAHDGHWSKEGHGVYADIMLNYLLEEDESSK